MGYPLTFASLIGCVALIGIVVNDSIVLVDRINNHRRESESLSQAVVLGARNRLRAILLTSVTTIVGLAPLMLESSIQAQQLIPLAISLSFGLAFSTVITLIIIPALCLVFDDFRRGISAVRRTARLWPVEDRLPACPLSH